MPVAKGPSFDLRSALIFGGVAVVAAIVIGFFAIRLGQQSNTLVLGDQSFSSLNIFSMADNIDRDGPILWPDIANGERDIWLTHIGDDLAEGWFAFDARNDGAARDCNVTWSVADQVFTDPCTGDTYPETGEGLPQIPVYIDETELILDINGIHTEDDFAGFTSE